MKTPRILIYMTVIILFSCSGDWLEERPNKALVVPEDIADYELLLNNPNNFNLFPSFGQISSDDYYIPDEAFSSVSNQFERNLYLWVKDDVYAGRPSNDWYMLYRTVFVANTIIRGVEENFTESEAENWNQIKGSAHFHRARAFLQAADLFATPYNPAEAAITPGIPLRLNPEVSEVSSRATMERTYDQIGEDLEIAIALLPTIVSIKTRPSKAAAYGLAARYYLVLGDYNSAMEAANNALEINSTLLDYNLINSGGNAPFTRFNDEVYFDAALANYSILSSSFSLVDPSLYQSYEDGDIRKEAFFRSGPMGMMFKGTYNGNRGPGSLFAGITTAEMYLVKAECEVRTGNLESGVAALNALVVNRYRYEGFKPLKAETVKDAIQLVIDQRRKELAFRGLRFSDLRRFNQEPDFAVSIFRYFEDEVYELPPNDLRYTFPIPDEVISATDMVQNPR